MSREAWEAEIKAWQEVLANPNKYSWTGFKTAEEHMALCRLCGKAEKEHWGGPHDFEPGGRVGHDSSKYVQNPQDVVNIPTIFPVKSNPKFHAALKKMAEVHDKKSLDYADTANGNYYTNFEEAAREAGVSVEEAFLVLIGVKLARLRELKKKALAPQNESVQDSRLDLANYCVLMYSYFID